ncbi:hypothetical protein J3U57_12245 [Gilliamella sp. B3464]|uniref:hypothetical protein n=1 Tax=unclassified Gilliamella TaxID=2685620 RepID=UPI00226A05C3|nr:MULTISPECIES: hypothetical protein [unclassified Gilliamella]MCX8713289.1 hypothetical protein [Gilliamella sp. B3468]MCX8752342.1 hypothetical protein [Gilliamella sp. B3464]
MSVDLTSLPPTLPNPKKFNFLFWGGVLIVFVVIGCITTFVLSFFYTIANLLFVFGALVLPVLIWVFIFLYGLYYRGYRETYIKQWNAYRDIRYQQLVNYARRGLYVLYYNLTTEYSEYNNANGIVNNRFALITKRHPSGSSIIPHSALSLPNNVNSGDFYERLEPLFKQWQQHYKSYFNQLPSDLNIHVRFFIDSTSPIENLENLWSQTVGSLIRTSSFKIEDTKSSSKFIEAWLDNSDHDDDLLLVISAHLFNSPTKNEGEFASLMLLAGERAVKTPFLSTLQLPLVKVCRSEQTDSLSQTIDKALLWGNTDNKRFDGVWYGGISNDINIQIMNHFNDIDFKPNGIFNIDTSIGSVGYSTYWLALALAVENTLTTKNKQFVIVGNPNISAQVVEYLQGK